jgi:2-oxoglutarate dehydrogenase E2 component (dihydrolipoamide succinyltransferase)
MALLEVKVPQLSESVAEATLLQWHKKIGDKVARDENLIDIETDKVVLELPAPDAGVITQVLKGDGDTVTAGEVIAIIDTEATAAAPVASAASAAEKKPAQAVPAQAASPANTASTSMAMPSAAKMLSENALTPDQVSGTGKDGRVTKGDVIHHLESGAQGSSAPAIPVKGSKPALASVPSPQLNFGARPEERASR